MCNQDFRKYLGTSLSAVVGSWVTGIKLQFPVGHHILCGFSSNPFLPRPALNSEKLIWKPCTIPTKSSKTFCMRPFDFYKSSKIFLNSCEILCKSNSMPCKRLQSCLAGEFLQEKSCENRTAPMSTIDKTDTIQMNCFLFFFTMQKVHCSMNP